ncbi:hypothetical protein ScPMuIL_009283 [Solemya velum]
MANAVIHTNQEGYTDDFSPSDQECDRSPISSSVVTSGCGPGRYMDGRGKCKLCFGFCGNDGCTGPSDVLGEGGCSSCWLGMEQNSSLVKCVSPYQDCPDGFYSDLSPRLSHTHPQQRICRRCHPLCVRCQGHGVSYCSQCRYYSFEGMCVLRCPTDSLINENDRSCFFPRGNRRRQLYHYRLYRRRHSMDLDDDV